MKGYKIYFAIGVIGILLYLVAQYNKPAPTDWTPTYLSTDKIPYGTYILYHRLGDVMPRATVTQSGTAVYNTLKNKPYQNTTYLIVAQRADISLSDFEQMKRYMKAGNNIFIAAYSFGKIEKVLKIGTAANMPQQGKGLNFTNPDLKTDANYGFERGIGSQFFREIDHQKATVLGVNANQQPNFIKYDFGKGAMYLIAEPGFYTNFNLLDKYGAEYAGKTLSYVQNSRHVILDQYFAASKNESTDMLRVFFQHPELKWAYYLTICGLVIFVLYDMKRRQRIIPVADPLRNSSVDFVQVVGSVYYHERNNVDIARKKINYFMEYLRSRYFIKTNEINTDFSRVLMDKTGINETLAKTLTRYFIQIPQINEFNDYELISLNGAIEQFYKNTQNHGAGTI